jgi:hypothetical protein
MKKYITLFLVISIVALSVNLRAKEKRGAELVVVKKNGSSVRGELVAAKKDALLLNLPYSSITFSVAISDITTITAGDRSYAGAGAHTGFLIAGFLGAVEASTCSGWGCGEAEIIVGSAILHGLLGGLIGYGIGGLFTGKESYVFEDKTESEIQEILQKLRKKARVRNYQ